MSLFFVTTVLVLIIDIMSIELSANIQQVKLSVC